MASQPQQPVTPVLTVDCVAFDSRGRVLLIRRANEPFAGQYALPGGFVDAGETVEAACRRELTEETGLVAAKITLLGVYSEPGRDPRGPTVTVAFLTELSGRPKASSDASAAEWVADWMKRPLAFDHALIIADANRRLKRRQRRRLPKD